MTDTARPSGPTDVVLALPARRPGSIRRTLAFDVRPAPRWDQGVQIRATAQDRATGPNGAVHVLASARVQADLDAQFTVMDLRGPISERVRATLTGRRAASGFRAALVGTQGLDPDSLTSTILDDLPTVRMVIGYARMREEAGPLIPRTSPLVGVCSGWRPGGTATRRTEAAVPLLNRPPSSPALADILDDPDDFPDEEPLRPGSARRRRILDITPHGDRLDVLVYHRDSHIDRDGREGALHEYLARLSVDPGDLVVRAIEVEPRALPFPECPLAAPNAAVLIGTSLNTVTGTVRDHLAGVPGCTHLNDVLRFLRFVDPLTRSAIAEGDPGRWSPCSPN